MARGNNRAAKQTRSSFRQAGGSIIKFRHPYLAGQIDTAGVKVDEIDISASCKLDGRFFEATQNQDSARQVVLVDGSVVTITNNLLNGTITIPAIPTTGDVATGDFIAACQLIRSTGDSVGGLLYKTDFVNGRAHTKLFYGVTVQRCPDDVSEGNDVPVYNISLVYAGWIEAIASSVPEAKKRIWAVGSQKGLEAYFAPYPIQNVGGEKGTGNSAMSEYTLGGITDDVSAGSNWDNTSNSNKELYEGNNYPKTGDSVVSAPTKLPPDDDPSNDPSANNTQEKKNK